MLLQLGTPLKSVCRTIEPYTNWMPRLNMPVNPQPAISLIDPGPAQVKAVFTAGVPAGIGGGYAVGAADRAVPLGEVADLKSPLVCQLCGRPRKCGQLGNTKSESIYLRTRKRVRKLHHQIKETPKKTPPGVAATPKGIEEAVAANDLASQAAGRGGPHSS